MSQGDFSVHIYILPDTSVWQIGSLKSSG